MTSLFEEERKRFHKEVLKGLVRVNENGVPNFADASSKTSSDLAKEILDNMAGSEGVGEVVAQHAGKRFEQYVSDFVRRCFSNLSHIRPGIWDFARNQSLSDFEQYAHLIEISEAVKHDSQLAAVLGRDYVIKPDIVAWCEPISDETINERENLVDADISKLTPVRAGNNGLPILHASISCKWTIRSDRSQNSRTEALNLIRNRKGRLPHIVVVTAEPLPSRIASIALGTGDIDCAYHFALYELIAAVEKSGQEEAINLVNIMVEGKRLRDISDLPLDIAS